MKKVSVVSVLYYSEDLVEGLVENLKEKLGSHLLEIILVDNSCQSLLIDDCKVKVYNQKDNLGYGGALNFGVSKSKGEYLIIINPDNKLDNFNCEFNLLENSIITGIRDNEHFFLKFPSFYIDAIKYMTYKTFGMGKDIILNFEKKIYIKDSLTFIDWVYGDFFLIKKSNYEKVGGFDTLFFLFYEEVDLCKRAQENSINIRVLDSIEYSSLDRKSSSINVSEIKIINEMKSFVNYYRRYNSGKGLEIILIMLKLFFYLGKTVTLPLKKFSKFNKMNQIFNIRYEVLKNSKVKNK